MVTGAGTWYVRMVARAGSAIWLMNCWWLAGGTAIGGDGNCPHAGSAGRPERHDRYESDTHQPLLRRSHRSVTRIQPQIRCPCCRQFTVTAAPLGTCPTRRYPMDAPERMLSG